MLQFIRAKKAVISNASMWDTLNLLPREVLPNSYVDRINTTPQCESFMHLHLGFDAEVRIDCGSIMKQVQVFGFTRKFTVESVGNARLHNKYPTKNFSIFPYY